MKPKWIIALLCIATLFLFCEKESDLDKDGFTIEQGDCDDNDPSIYPGAKEICGDNIDQDCNGFDLDCDDVDQDLDGFTVNQGDCNDADSTSYPGATEICDDNIDQDCDGEDLRCYFADIDLDGFSPSEGDCDDADSTIYPGALEICDDGIDQDCNYSDLDCASADQDKDGYTIDDGDCNDNDASIYPGATENCCDNKDQNCDGFDFPVDFATIIQVCSGSGLAGFASYDPAAANHKVIIVTVEGKGSTWNTLLPAENVPSKLSRTELIVCIDIYTNLVQSCSYEGGRKIERYQSKCSVVIHEASTGKEITSKVFSGGSPGVCRASESFGEHQFTKFRYGSSVTYDDVKGWLKTIIK